MIGALEVIAFISFIFVLYYASSWNGEMVAQYLEILTLCLIGIGILEKLEELVEKKIEESD